MYDNGYTPPILTTDSVIFQLQKSGLTVLLIQRQQQPFKGSWALPGGYIASGETTTEAMSRTLQAKAGISSAQLGLIEQLYTFDTVARDPRGHAVSVTYMGLALGLEPVQDSTQQSPCFVPITDLPELAYDHADIIDYAQDRLRSKLSYTNAIYTLIPESFTLTQLQSAYESVLGRDLDKRNFRKRFLALGLIEETADMQREGAHRPARLYRFKQQKLQNLTSNFD